MEKLLLRRSEVANLLGMSLTTFNRRREAGQVLDPLPSFSGSFPRWNADEVKAWVAADCPTRDEWRSMKERQEAETR